MQQCPACKSTYQDNFSHCPRDGSALIDALLWSDGSVIRDKYRIISPAGAGGMASVFKAEHIQFKEFRALKVMNSEMLGDESFVRRFVQEALLTRKLQHPNAVRVDDIDKDEDGRPFIVMEFIEGRSLKALMDLGPIAEDKVKMIAHQVASALAAAHALGIVHRDIKPSNILLQKAPNGATAKVVDFGIARVSKAHPDSPKYALTTPGWVVGSPAYLSPEQAAEKPGEEIDGRSDLYSLGVVLYQMLTGELPLTGESTADFLNAHLHITPLDIRQRVPRLSDQTANLVMRCLSKRREDRPANAAAFLAELEAAPQPANDPEPSKPAVTSVRKEATPPVRAIPIWLMPPLLLAVLWVVLEFTEVYAFAAGFAALVVTDLCRFAFLRRLNVKTIATVFLAWLIATSAAAAFAYFSNPLATQLWSALVESIDITQSTIHQAMLLLSCLICVALGTFLTSRMLRY